MSNIRVRIRIDFGPGRAVGPGKIALLEALAETGSLSRAAKSLDMSYRRAWLLLKSLNEMGIEPVANSVKGGTGGGGASLTAYGRALIAAFRQVELIATHAGITHCGAFQTATDPASAASVRPVSPQEREADSGP